jgi:hypothetical protein
MLPPHLGGTSTSYGEEVPEAEGRKQGGKKDLFIYAFFYCLQFLLMSVYFIIFFEPMRRMDFHFTLGCLWILNKHKAFKLILFLLDFVPFIGPESLVRSFWGNTKKAWNR